MKNIFAKFTALFTHLLVLAVVLEVTARYIFGKSSAAISDMEVYAFSVVILFGGTVALFKNSHVNIDLLYGKMTNSHKKSVQIISVIFFLVPFCAVIIFSSYDYALTSFFLNEKSTDPGGLPYRYLLKSLIPLSFFALLAAGIKGIFEKKM